MRRATACPCKRRKALGDALRLSSCQVFSRPWLIGKSEKDAKGIAHLSPTAAVESPIGELLRHSPCFTPLASTIAGTKFRLAQNLEYYWRCSDLFAQLLSPTYPSQKEYRHQPHHRHGRAPHASHIAPELPPPIHKARNTTATRYRPHRHPMRHTILRTADRRMVQRPATSRHTTRRTR